jgi:hypothetical protein
MCYGGARDRRQWAHVECLGHYTQLSSFGIIIPETDIPRYGDVFSVAVRGQLGKGLGEPTPSIGIVQKAVGRLTRREILVRVERGEYYVQDDVFLEWLKRPT